MATSELDGTDRSEPPTDLARVFLIHVEKMRHHRLDDRFAFIVWRHRNRTAKYLQRATVPVFDNFVQGCEAVIDEGTQVIADLLASMPIRDAKIANRVLGK